MFFTGSRISCNGISARLSLGLSRAYNRGNWFISLGGSGSLWNDVLGVAKICPSRPGSKEYSSC